MAVTACGASGGTGTNPTPTPPAGGRFDVTVTEADHSVTMRSGQTLEVVLHAGSGLNDWTHPASSDPSILAPTVDPAAAAARGVTLAAFVATRPGQAEISATASPKCEANQPCPAYLALYSLKVTVTH